MCCGCYSVRQRMIWVFGLGTLFAAAGIALIIVWPNIPLNIMHNSLVLKPGTVGYESWVESSGPIYLEFHMFNWTNPEKIRDPNIKPNFVEKGPYVFLEKRLKENITFYSNDTVSYYERRTWFFDAQRSNGTLEDVVTSPNVITATIAEKIRHMNLFYKIAANSLLKASNAKLFVSKSVGEWIFEGYEDKLINLMKGLNTSEINKPRFGWLAYQNSSLEYGGLFMIRTGVDDISNLGQLTHWNGKNESDFYKPPCGVINGRTGDAFPPHLNPKAEITFFDTYSGRNMNLQPNGTLKRHGVEAFSWIGTVKTLDFGENYTSQQCLCNSEHDECPKTDAPIYVSFPHFHLADPSYKNAITGMNPDPEKHTFKISVEPFTGIPLEVNRRLQINMQINPDNSLDIYRGLPKVLMPMFWFEQKVQLDERFAKKAKLVINLENYGTTYFAISFICLGGVLILIGIILTITKRWRRTYHIIKPL